jgi:protein-tyrosine phosphatase
MAGISRSATIVAAYLLCKYKYTLAQVLSMIQRKRKKV